MADSKLKKLEDVIKDLQDYMGPKATLGKIKDILTAWGIWSPSRKTDVIKRIMGEEWLLDDTHSKSDYDNKLNELNGILQPIMMKAMGQGGTDNSPANESVPPTKGTPVGPTIDEVD